MLQAGPRWIRDLCSAYLILVIKTTVLAWVTRVRKRGSVLMDKAYHKVYLVIVNQIEVFMFSVVVRSAGVLVKFVHVLYSSEDAPSK